MQKKKIIFNIIFVFSMIILTIYSSCYATTVQITKENLEQSFQNILSSQSVQDNGITGVEVGDDTITVSTTNKENKMKYDLTDNPTFTVEMNIQDGMSYDEYEEEEENLSSIMLSYLAIANLNNVEVDKAFWYFALTYMGDGLSNGGLQSSEYIIYDDRDLDSDADVEIDADGKTVIKASEFEKYAMDYANSLLKEPETISDADKGNTYQLYMEKQDVTDTSCKIVFTLTVNKDADFSVIGKDTEDEENQEEQTNQVQTPTNTSRNNIDNTTANTRLPKAGASATICVILGVAVLIAIFGLKYRNLKDVK